MKRTELKKVLKPLIKECIKEVMFEEGVLSGIISEVVQGLSNNTIVEQKTPPAEQSRPAAPSPASMVLRENRKRMLDSIGKNTTYGGVDLFEGTTPLRSDGAGGGSTHSALAGTNPDDPGVNIDGIVSLAGGAWKKMVG